MPRDNTRNVSHVTTQESVNIRDELRDAQLEWQKGFMFKTLGAVSIMIVILGVLLFGTNYYIQDYSGLKLPPGTIIAWIPGADEQLPNRWQICDGSVITEG